MCNNLNSSHSNQMKKHSFASAQTLLLAALLAAAGCASTTNLRNSVTGYGGQARDMRDALASGSDERIKREARDLDDDCKSADRILYLQEQGRLLSLCGDSAGAIADYQIASDTFEATRMKAVLSASNAYFAATAIATNDLSIPYEGHGFEKVMLHNLQAINYILTNNYDFARIELNHADVEQTFSLEQHAKLLAQAEQQRQEQQLNLDASNATLAQKTSQDMFGAGAVKNSFQNAFTFYLRGALFEDSRDFDKALIEYKKALEIYPANRFIAESAMRTARLCGADRDRQNLVNAFGIALRGDACPAGSERLVVVYESGFIRARSWFKLSFVWNNNVLELVLPFYDMGSYCQPDELDVSAATVGAHTQTICNLDAMAVRSLDEQYKAILVRQVLRMIAKYKMQAQAGDGALGLLMKVTTLVTDRADDRNWLTLPQSVEIAELFLPVGQQNITCSTSSISRTVTVNMEAGKTHFLIVTGLGPTLVVQGGDIVQPAATAAKK
jgi:uncharacterized protein